VREQVTVVISGESARKGVGQGERRPGGNWRIASGEVGRRRSVWSALAASRFVERLSG